MEVLKMMFVSVALLVTSVLCSAMAVWCLFRAIRPPDWVPELHLPRMREVLKQDSLKFGCMAFVLAALTALVWT
jgi:hypothetical protein